MIEEFVQSVQHMRRAMTSILEARARGRDKKNEVMLQADQLKAIRSHTPNQPPAIDIAPALVGFKPRKAKPSPGHFQRTSLDRSDERVPPPPLPPPSPITRPMPEKSSTPPWSHFVRPLTFNTPIFRGQEGLNLYPGPDIVPQLARASDELAYASANLQLVGGYFHSRAYTLEFSANRFFVVCVLSSGFPWLISVQIRPLLHTSVNIYTKDIWHKWIRRAYSKGFVVVIAFDFGSHVLSFNSKDGNVQVSNQYKVACNPTSILSFHGLLAFLDGSNVHLLQYV